MGSRTVTPGHWVLGLRLCPGGDTLDHRKGRVRCQIGPPRRGELGLKTNGSPSPSPSFFLETLKSLRCNLHNMKFTILKCVVQWFLVFS